MNAATRRKRAILRDRRRYGVAAPVPTAFGIAPMTGWDLWMLSQVRLLDQVALPTPPPAELPDPFAFLRRTAQLVKPVGMSPAEMDQAVREVWEGLT